MTLERFLRERRAGWEELDALVGRAGRRAESLGPEGVLRLGELYRATAADLALARRAFPRDPIVERLEQLAGRARTLVYDAPTRRGSVVDFFRRDYWRLVRARPLPLLIAIAVLAGSTVLSGIWAVRDPGAAAGLVPGQYRAVTEPQPKGAGLGLSSSEEARISAEIFTNNIQVTFLSFAAGLLLGVGSALLLLYNGVLLGVVGGLAIGSGNGPRFFELVTAHGVLELSCIVVASAAGMRLGWAVVDPGRRTRTRALTEEARQSIGIVLGTAPWLVVAGLTEAFVTPSGLTIPSALAIGCALGAIYWALLLRLG